MSRLFPVKHFLHFRAIPDDLRPGVRLHVLALRGAVQLSRRNRVAAVPIRIVAEFYRAVNLHFELYDVGEIGNAEIAHGEGNISVVGIVFCGNVHFQNVSFTALRRFRSGDHFRSRTCRRNVHKLLRVEKFDFVFRIADPDIAFVVGRFIAAGIGGAVNDRVPFRRCGDLHVFLFVFLYGIHSRARVVFDDVSGGNRFAAVVHDGRLGNFHFIAADPRHVIGRGDGGLFAVRRRKFRDAYRGRRFSVILIRCRIRNGIGGRAEIFRIESFGFFVVIYRTPRSCGDGNFHLVILHPFHLRVGHQGVVAVAATSTVTVKGFFSLSPHAANVVNIVSVNTALTSHDKSLFILVLPNCF